jgi:23S rRNA (uracil1939-C5)-methyltransferase
MGAIIELELTGMAYGGAAIGRHEGRAIFVTGGISRERVRARIRQDKGRFALADLVEVLEPSPARVTPRCSHVGQCGGCHWQHIDYAAQLTFKGQIVRDQLARIGGLPEVDVRPTLPSQPAWAYRSHATFHPARDGRLGFIGVDDRRVIAIDECPISRPELLSLAGSLPAQAQRFHPGDRVRVQVGSERDTYLVAVSAREDSPAQVIAGAAAVQYTVKGKAFRVSAGSFFQVNVAQAAALVDQVMAWLEPVQAGTVLDLYSGVGLFSAFLAECADRLIAIESFPQAVEDARFNLRQHANIEFHTGAVELLLGTLGAPVEAAVVDPPRAGMNPAALEALIGSAPARLAYVSCDPSTLARDARRLVAAGYHLDHVQPVDMFPQTYHIEAVACFWR